MTTTKHVDLRAECILQISDDPQYPHELIREKPLLAQLAKLIVSGLPTQTNYKKYGKVRHL